MAKESAKLPPAGKHPVRFLFPPLAKAAGKSAKKKPTAGNPAAGLFVIWAAVALDTDASSPSAQFKLGFCANDGALYDVAKLANPWPLAIRTKKGKGGDLGATPEQWSPQK